MTAPASPDDHAFVRRPHRTLVGLSIPVMFSLIAEPLTGAVDTAFLAQLGAVPAAALGVATMLLSSLFWIFNFLGVGTQTEVARALGEAAPDHARDAAGLALALALSIGVGLALLSWPVLEVAVAFMSTDILVQRASVTYLEIRLIGGPAVLLTMAAFGAMRGLQDMRTPLQIAVAANVINVMLDVVLISGFGPVPAMGVAGAAWAATVGQWVGALWALYAVRRRLGLPPALRWREARSLLRVGRDLTARTGLLLLFIFLGTRAATLSGTEVGAAHQAIRQIWMLSALVLDAFAMTAQSLIGFFHSGNRSDLARRVAGVACVWGLGSGVLLTVGMLASTDIVALLLVPESAREIFPRAWIIAAITQPLNALSFVTDGIHWGTRDYPYLRNAMFTATGVGTLILFAISGEPEAALAWIWWATAVWIAIRTLFGMGRIWPGWGTSPLK